MKSVYLIVLLSVFISCKKNNAQTQKTENQPLVTVTEIQAKPLAILPSKCSESSGLEVIGKSIFTINDSGGKAEIYQINQAGKLEQTLKIEGAKNTDWEALAANEQYFFIGDFGNNDGDRENLKIYRFDRNNPEAKSKKIKFSYANQSNFSKRDHAHSFDCEAMTIIDNQLVLFSKDWVNGKAIAYHLPIKSNEKLSIKESESLAVNALITGADYNSNTRQLVLCGHNKNYDNFLWLFDNSSAENLFPTNYKKLSLKGLKNAQIEGVAWLDDTTILLSSENNKTFQQQLFVVPVR